MKEVHEETEELHEKTKRQRRTWKRRRREERRGLEERRGEKRRRTRYKRTGRGQDSIETNITKVTSIENQNLTLRQSNPQGKNCTHLRDVPRVA